MTPLDGARRRSSVPVAWQFNLFLS
uniref:Uncharacterized protein n=1 Tax=Anguilla anguilla TaxID=7936 RepID=A0A0E9RH26_ANGAN